MTDDRTATAFSKEFAAALRGYMDQKGLSQPPLRKALGRSQGYVSERLSGLRPIDTDMMDAVAELTGVSTKRLHKIVLRRMSEAAETPQDTAERIAAEAIKREAEKRAAEQEQAKPVRRRRRA